MLLRLIDSSFVCVMLVACVCVYEMPLDLKREISQEKVRGLRGGLCVVYVFSQEKAKARKNGGCLQTPPEPRGRSLPG